MKQKEAADSKKTLISFACIGMALVGLVLGFLMPSPLANAFSPGALIAFVAFLLSLSAVKDKGNNLPAILAFSTSFLAMAISMFWSGMAS